MNAIGERPNTWMPMYWGDYLRDTGHLGALEHGAYLLLIGHYWVTGEPLPDDDRQLRNITKLSGHFWKKIRHILEKFFVVEDGVWKHRRIEKELMKAAENKAARTEKARAAASARWENDNATSMPGECPSPSPPSVPKGTSGEGAQDTPPPRNDGELLDLGPFRREQAEAKGDDPKPKPKAARGSRLSPDWSLPDELRQWAIGEGMSPADVQRQVDRFRDYWIAQPGQKGVKLDWSATWRNWIRRDLDQMRGRPSSGGSSADVLDGLAERRRQVSGGEK